MTLNELYHLCDSIQYDTEVTIINYTNGKQKFTGFFVDAIRFFGDYLIIEFIIRRFDIVRQQVSHLFITCRKAGTYDII